MTLMGTVDAALAARALAKLALQVTGGSLEEAATLALDVLAAASHTSSASSSPSQALSMGARASVVAPSLCTDSRTLVGADRSRSPPRSSKKRPPSLSPEKERKNHNEAEKVALVDHVTLLEKLRVESHLRSQAEELAARRQGMDEVGRQVAEFECESLQRCSPTEAQHLKRKSGQWIIYGPKIPIP